MGVVGAVGLCIAPTGGDELPGGDTPTTGPPDAENEYGCQKIGVEGEGKGATCGVEFPGNAVPGLLWPTAPVGRPPAGAGDIEEAEGAKDGVEEDGDMPIPI